MPVKYYADAHIAKSVVVQARRFGVDIVHCAEINQDNAADLEHLKYATEQKRTMITSDADFAAIHSMYQEKGEQHAGIIYIIPARKDDIGMIVNFIVELHNLIEIGAGDVENDVYNRLMYL